ncbi:MAG: hypothetical protein JXB17_02405 [Bacteroidales bacterium]|nr:hypothetical protein [Bacteroidales bacterium]
MEIKKYSFGIGDRFAHQGKAQLEAIIKANKGGVEITPVWNKSNREHQIVKTTHAQTRTEADDAVKALNFKTQYLVDADHINLSNVDNFINYSDFFTLDVADNIGEKAANEEIKSFIENNKQYIGNLQIPGIDESFNLSEDALQNIAENFLSAVKQASKIYQYIVSKKGEGNFVTEVSMDEVEQPQTPIELFFILKMISEEKIPAQTIAPKFSGRFNKGVDYVGDINQFAKEFEQDLLVIDYAIKKFNLPANLKLSVHSGSDKFSIYPVIGKLIKKHDKGLHIKTAGTTWLEEIIGLALSSDEGLKIAKDIYTKAYERIDELCGPYATVIDINKENLPKSIVINNWTSEKFVNALRHIPGHPEFNPNLRQLLHVGYKIAAEMGERYTNALKKYENIIAKEVTENIFDRHIKRLFNL